MIGRTAKISIPTKSAAIGIRLADSIAPFAFLVCLLVIGSAATLRAAPLQLDLGEGLIYFRAHELPADLPPAAAKSGPLVLDLRYTSAAESAANALDAWLKFRATATTPVFVLVNATTPKVFLNVLATYKATPGLLTLGPKWAEHQPDIVTAISTDDERKAYDALEHGASLESLVTQNTGKPRNDEASLVQSRTNPPADVVDADPADFEEKVVAPNPPVRPVPAPVIDVTLQRVIQLHRALVALKRL